jgi:lipopolysaccharide/colanic/teichoic acid biosynthesis glycosyltransferase
MQYTNTRQSTPRISVHTFNSKKSSSKTILVVTGYDYFLQKYDLKRLLAKYAKIILVPRSVEDREFLVDTVAPILSKNHNIHLVTNPMYDRQHQIIYQLSINHSKIIEINTVYEFCERYLRKIYIPESIGDANPHIETYKPFTWPVKFAKKVIDGFAGFVLLPMTLPVWGVSTLIIKKQSPGSVFYSQTRLGLNAKEFKCIKFRSMRLDAEAGGARFASRNDGRTFPYGKLMRITRIDELPQLLNLVKGEISLIGPRPERGVFVESFVEEIPYYQQRLLVKPGISGYAQVMYPYGSGVKDARHKLMYDLYYIKNWSLGLELEIVWRTLGTVLLSKGI